MLEARCRQRHDVGRPETAQLLLIVSDGRGVNSKGVGVVRRAVRQAREANVFIIFVILDDPKNKVGLNWVFFSQSESLLSVIVKFFFYTYTFSSPVQYLCCVLQTEMFVCYGQFRMLDNSSSD